MNDKQNHSHGAGCPGAAMKQFAAGERAGAKSELTQWPVQLELVPPNAPYFKDTDLVVTADCVPFAYADYHKEFLKGRPVAVACPKHDNPEKYIRKLVEIFKLSPPSAIEVLVMEVPCCGGLVQAVRIAKDQAGVNTPVRVTTIGVRGEHLGTQNV